MDFVGCNLSGHKTAEMSPTVFEVGAFVYPQLVVVVRQVGDDMVVTVPEMVPVLFIFFFVLQSLAI